MKIHLITKKVIKNQKQKLNKADALLETSKLSHKKTPQCLMHVNNVQLKH